jgi:serine/threonine-protein kinase
MLNKMVAIKLVRKEIVDPEAFLRILFEGRASALLTHPYLIKVQDFGITDSGRPFLVMDFVDGKTMSDLFSEMEMEKERISASRFISLFSQVCEAMAHAHERGVLHRDIKPSNIMVVINHAGQEEIRVMDFGVAKIPKDSQTPMESITKLGATLGSPLYMSPEHAIGNPSDARSDIYSLGCVMYEAINGHPPFRGKTKVLTLFQHVNQAPAPIRILNIPPEVQSKISALVLRMLSKDPNDRFQTMNEVLIELTAVQALLLSKSNGLSESNGRNKSNEPPNHLAQGMPAEERARRTNLFQWIGARLVATKAKALSFLNLSANGDLDGCTAVPPYVVSPAATCQLQDSSVS